jgi:YebC/PmpR family DNA-binding regulatory protein
MSGHSKWSTIKRQKGAADAKRGQTFTKLANAISIAARSGGDPEMNFKLRLTIDKARQANMPKDNIERAIKRGTGELGGERIEDVLYEAYGPGGIALLIEAATDNRNRASSSIRAILNKYDGKLAESGAVAFQFKQRGIVTVNLADKSLEEAEMIVIDSGAEDYEAQDNTLLVYTDPKETEKVRQSLIAGGLDVADTSLSWEPTAMIEISDPKKASSLLKMMDALEELDDVGSVSGNFDIPESIIKEIN